MPLKIGHLDSIQSNADLHIMDSFAKKALLVFSPGKPLAGLENHCKLSEVNMNCNEV